MCLAALFVFSLAKISGRFYLVGWQWGFGGPKERISRKILCPQADARDLVDFETLSTSYLYFTGSFL